MFTVFRQQMCSNQLPHILLRKTRMLKHFLMLNPSKPNKYINAISISTMQQKPIETSIRNKLKEALNPSYIEVINESYMHNVPKGAETHFKVIVVSENFNEKALIARHRIVNELLENELKSGVHALSIVAKTPKQWEESTQKVDPSPACRGGFGK